MRWLLNDRYCKAYRGTRDGSRLVKSPLYSMYCTSIDLDCRVYCGKIDNQRIWVWVFCRVRGKHPLVADRTASTLRVCWWIWDGEGSPLRRRWGPRWSNVGSSCVSCMRGTNCTSSNDDDDDETVSRSWIRLSIPLTYFGDDDGGDGIGRWRCMDRFGYP